MYILYRFIVFPLCIFSDLLKRAAPSRIINYGSVVHWRARELDIDNLNFQKGGAGYFKIYGTSKLCVMLFTRELARRLQGTGVVANVLHPGLTDTPTYDRPQPFWFRVVNWLPRKLLFKVIVFNYGDFNYFNYFTFCLLKHYNSAV